MLKIKVQGVDIIKKKKILDKNVIFIGEVHHTITDNKMCNVYDIIEFIVNANKYENILILTEMYGMPASCRSTNLKVIHIDNRFYLNIFGHNINYLSYLFKYKLKSSCDIIKCKIISDKFNNYFNILHDVIINNESLNIYSKQFYIKSVYIDIETIFQIITCEQHNIIIHTGSAHTVRYYNFILYLHDNYEYADIFPLLDEANFNDTSYKRNFYEIKCETDIENLIFVKNIEIFVKPQLIEKFNQCNLFFLKNKMP